MRKILGNNVSYAFDFVQSSNTIATLVVPFHSDLKHELRPVYASYPRTSSRLVQGLREHDLFEVETISTLAVGALCVALLF
jgi:hypothetical protein